MVSIDFKKAFVEDVREIDLALRVLNSLRDTNLAKTRYYQSSGKRGVT